MGIPLSQRAYAEHRRCWGLPGGTHRAVQKAIERGAIFPEADGKIEPDKADLDWARNSEEPRTIPDVEIQATAGRVVAVQAPVAPPQPPPPPEPAWIARPEPLPLPPAAPVVAPAAVVEVEAPAAAGEVGPVEPVASVEEARRPRGRPRSAAVHERPAMPVHEAGLPSVPIAAAGPLREGGHAGAPPVPTFAPELAAAERTRGTVAEASAELKRHQAAIAKLRLEELAGELVRADEVRHELDELIITARNRLLGIAAAFRARCPHVSPADVRILEAMIRDVLQDLAESAAAERAA